MTVLAAVPAAIPPGAAAMAAAMIRHYEGFRAFPYWDAYGRCWSVGYGFCTLLDGSVVTQRTPALSLDACDLLLERKLQASYMPTVLARCVGITLTDAQLAALTDFAWNEGPGRIAEAGLPALLRARNWPGASAVLCRYVYAGGVRLAGLATRRAEEGAVLCGAPWPVPVGHPAAAAHGIAPHAPEPATDALNAAELASLHSQAP